MWFWRRVDVGGRDPVLLDPEPVDVVLESQPGREERRQPERVVVAGDAAVHPPVLLGHHGPEVDQDVELVEVVGVNLVLVFQEQLDEVEGIDVVGSRAKRLGHLDDGAGGHRPALEEQGVFAGEPLRRVGLQVHRGVDQDLALLVVVGNILGALAEHVEE